MRALIALILIFMIPFWWLRRVTVALLNAASLKSHFAPQISRLHATVSSSPVLAGNTRFLFFHVSAAQVGS